MILFTAFHADTIVVFAVESDFVGFKRRGQGDEILVDRRTADEQIAGQIADPVGRTCE